MSLEEFRSHLGATAPDVPCDVEILRGERSPLSSPLRLGSIAIGNRWAVQPMEGWDGTADGNPSDLSRSGDERGEHAARLPVQTVHGMDRLPSPRFDYPRISAYPFVDHLDDPHVMRGPLVYRQPSGFVHDENAVPLKNDPVGIELRQGVYHGEFLSRQGIGR